MTPRVKRLTRATVATRLTPKTEPRAAQSIFMSLVPYTAAAGAGGAAGSMGAGAGMVVLRSSSATAATEPAGGGGVTAAMAVVTTPAGSASASRSSAVTLCWSTGLRRDSAQMTAEPET